MKNIYKKALEAVQRRIDHCEKYSKKNNMQDCGWSDRQHHANSMRKMYEAIYKFEKISRRLEKAT